MGRRAGMGMRRVARVCGAGEAGPYLVRTPDTMVMRFASPTGGLPDLVGMLPATGTPTHDPPD